MALDLLSQLQGQCFRGVNVLLPKPVGLAAGAFWACWGEAEVGGPHFLVWPEAWD